MVWSILKAKDICDSYVIKLLLVLKSENLVSNIIIFIYKNMDSQNKTNKKRKLLMLHNNNFMFFD